MTTIGLGSKTDSLKSNYEVAMSESNEPGSYPPERKGTRDNPQASKKRKEFSDSDVAPLESYGALDNNSKSHMNDSAHSDVPSGNAANSSTTIPVLDHRVTRLEYDFKHIRRHVESLVESLPGKSADEHAEHHDAYGEQLKVRREKDAEDKKLKRDLKEKFIKTVIQGVFMAVLAVMMLGVKSQFSEWINKAVDEKAAEKAHKDIVKESAK